MHVVAANLPICTVVHMAVVRHGKVREEGTHVCYGLPIIMGTGGQAPRDCWVAASFVSLCTPTALLAIPKPQLYGPRDTPWPHVTKNACEGLPNIYNMCALDSSRRGGRAALLISQREERVPGWNYTNPDTPWPSN